VSKLKILSIFILLVTLLFSCHNHSHDEQNEHNDHGHEHEHNSLNYTVWGSNYELYIEFEPFVISKTVELSAHFTSLDDFKPLTDAQLIISFIQDGKTSTIEMNKYSSPGIYVFTHKVHSENDLSISIEIISKKGNDTIILADIPVFSDEHSALHYADDNALSSGISFTKEQVWKIDFAVEEILYSDFFEVEKTTGFISPSSSDLTIITAKTSGVVSFSKSELYKGTPIRSGDEIFKIIGSGFTDSNIELRYQTAIRNYEKAEQELVIAKSMYEGNLISGRELLEANNNFDNANMNLKSIRDNFSEGGLKISSTVSGFISGLFVANGQYVESGTPLLSLSRDNKLSVQADISPLQLSKIPNLNSAIFSAPYTDTSYLLSDLDGRLVSVGKQIIENNFIPITFEIKKSGNLLAGSFINVYLLGNSINNVLTIPKSAILEETGRHYVFVQLAGELYDKREIKLGGFDGRRYHILSGLSLGERVVTSGTYQLKLASVVGGLPDHGHHH